MQIKHPKTNNIADWTQADVNAQIALGNLPAGTTLNDLTLHSDWNAAHTVTGTASSLAGYDGSGNSQDVTVGSGLSLSGGTLSASGGGVTSFNTRTGAVTLTSSDVTTALGDANIAYLDVAQTFTKSQTIQGTDDSTIAFIAKSHSNTNAANIQEWQRGTDSAKLGMIDYNGNLSSITVAGGRPTIDTGYMQLTSGGAPGASVYYGTVGSQTRRLLFGWDSSQARSLLYDDGGAVGIFLFDSGNLAFGGGPGINVVANNNIIVNPTTSPYVTLRARDALTSTIANGVTIDHTTSGTPAAGFGVSIQNNLQSSTTVGRLGSEIDTTWIVATDATRTGRMTLGAHDYNTSAGSPREAIRMDANGSAALIGFYGTTAVVQQSGDIGTALSNYGLVTSPTLAASSLTGTAGLYATIVGNDRKTGLTAAQALATYTVGASDATYMVSANVLVTASAIHNFSVTCSYTDESNTARVLTLNFSQLTGAFITAITNGTGASSYEGVPVHIRAKASTTIIIQSTAAGTYTSVTYNLEERIQQL